jgi:hypothetical protein
VQGHERVHNGGDIIGSPPGKEEVPRGQPVAALIVGDHRQGHRANLVWPGDEIPAKEESTGGGPLPEESGRFWWRKDVFNANTESDDH